MNRLIKKLHTYTGLLSFSALIVYGIAGLTASFEAAPEDRHQEVGAVRYEPFTPAAGLSDGEVADVVYKHLNPPLSGPVPSWALKRDSENNLRLDFWSVNEVQRVTVLEKESRLRIETTRWSPWVYLNNLHTTTMRAELPDVRLKLWAYYNEFAIWSLIGMALSGTYLGLSSRPGYRLARYALAGGGAVFFAVYILTR